jgi:hypothetical protein
VTVSALIETYIRAKDTNRPHLMSTAFAPDVSLEMVVRAGSISFPPRSLGLDAVTDVLIRQFGRTYENVYTFCLCAPPASDEPQFSCAWLVGMSEKESGGLRLGSGRYAWSFRLERGVRKVCGLKITIDQMSTLPASLVPAAMSWLGQLPYPWCPVETVMETVPRIAEFAHVTGQLEALCAGADHAMAAGPR